MLNKFVSLLLLVSLAGLSACTTANRPTGQSEVRQAPDDEYNANQPMGGAEGRAPDGTMTGSPSIDQTSGDTATDSGTVDNP